MRNIYTPEENMILTLDYYVDKLIEEIIKAEQKIKEEEEIYMATKDVETAIKRKRNQNEYYGMIKAYRKVIRILKERD